MDAQKIFRVMFKALISEEYFIGTKTESYRGALEHAIRKVDFSMGTGGNMLPSNLNLNITGYKI